MVHVPKQFICKNPYTSSCKSAHKSEIKLKSFQKEVGGNGMYDGQVELV